MDGVHRMLARNNACHQCRKRKLRCDGQRPICTNCAKPRVRGVSAAQRANPPRAECTWDERKHHRRDREEENEGLDDPERLKLLEERLATFERAMNIRDTEDNVSTARFPAASVGTSNGVDSGEPLSLDLDMEWNPNQETIRTGSLGNSSSRKCMARSDWPRELPPIDTVQHVVDVFFEKVPTFPKMLRKSAIQQHLLLPPSHYRFPAQPLLHAILCVTSAYLPPAVLSDRSYWPIGTPWNATVHPDTDQDISSSKGPSSIGNLTGALHPNGKQAMKSSAAGRFQLWHRRQALECVTIYADRGQQYLQLIQSIILVTATDQLNAWWDDLWQMSGSCVRLAVPLRLYQGSGTFNMLSGFSDGGCPAAENALEQAEMDRTWWMAYLMERTASMWTTWPLVLSDDEITCELPVLQSTYDRGYGDLIGVQSIHAEDLYFAHPPRHLDSLSLLIKAVKLLADAQRFIRFYRRKAHTIERYTNESSFRLLLSHVNSFHLSLPGHMRKPTQNVAEGSQLDRDALLAVMLAHATLIVLGEPFLTSELWQRDIARMTLTAIRVILSLVYDITATSYDITLLPPSVSYVFFLASKGLLRFLYSARDVGDTVSAAVFRSEIGVFQMALRQYGQRFPLGEKHATMLEDMIGNQDLAEPNQAHMGTIENMTYSDMQLDSIEALGDSDGISYVDFSSSSGNTPGVLPRSPVSTGPTLSSAASASAPGEQWMLDISGKNAPFPTPMASFFTGAGPLDFSIDDFLNSSNPLESQIPSSGTSWLDVSNVSFDPQHVAELFGSVTGAGYAI